MLPLELVELIGQRAPLENLPVDDVGDELPAPLRDQREPPAERVAEELRHLPSVHGPGLHLVVALDLPVLLVEREAVEALVGADRVGVERHRHRAVEDLVTPTRRAVVPAERAGAHPYLLTTKVRSPALNICWMPRASSHVSASFAVLNCTVTT